MASALCPVLVGREAEFTVLRDRLTEATVGRGRCVLLTGEAGIGKSRLVREAVTAALDDGLTVVTGRASPAEASVPYRPLADALRQLLRRSALPDDAAGARANTLASLLSYRDSGPPIESSAPAVAEAMVRQLDAIAPRTGLLLVLEDLHWTDPDTLTVLDYLIDNISLLPVLLLVTCRSDPFSPAMALVHRVRVRPATTHLPLVRLDAAQTASMVRACSSDSDDDLVARILALSEGVPLLVEEALAVPGLGGSLADSVRERMMALTADERLIIEAAAVLAREFEWELLEPITGQSTTLVASAMDRGIDLLLLRIDDGAFRFRHALTRGAVLACLPPPRHRALAATALAVLETRHRLTGRWREVAADLAVRSGDPVRAGRLLTQSGRHALDRGALATATETLRRAADLLEGSAELDEAQTALVEALALAGRVDDAVAVGHRVITRLGMEDRTRAARLGIHLRLAEAAVAAARWTMARHQLHCAQEITAADPGLAPRAQMSVIAAEIAFAADDVALARELAQDALAVAAAPPAVRCQALELIGRSHRLVDLAAARTAFEDALVTAQSADLPVWQLRASHELGTLDMFDHAGTTRLLAARRTAGELGALSTAAVLDLQLTAVFTCQWDLAAADTHAASALALSERLGLDQVRPKALAMLAGSAGMRTDEERMEEYLARTQSAAPDDEMLKGLAWGCRGTLLLLRDEPARAVVPFRRGIDILSRLPHAEPAALRALWPLLLAHLGERETRSAIDTARSLGVTAFNVNAGLVGYAEAILAGRAGALRQANELAGSADRLFLNCEPWAELARWLTAPAALSDGWGHPEQWLSAARIGFAERGLDQLAESCDELLARSQPNPWAGLGVTAREADVLRLLATGMTNKEIGGQLHLSPRTVEKHVENLRRKLGAHSRTDLALAAVSAHPTT